MLDLTFSSTQVLIGAAMLVLLLFGIGWWGKRYFRLSAKDTAVAAESSRTKYQRVDVFRHQPTFLRVGLICSLAFVVLAFNFTEYATTADFIELGEDDEDIFILTEPPITTHPPPPPPPPQFQAVDDLNLPDTITFQSMDITDTASVAPPVITEPVKPKYIPPPPPIPQDEPNIVVIAEQMPIFGDCLNEADKALRKQCSDRAIMTFIGKRIRYPAIAKENGISGNAVIRFVVERDGTLSNIEVVRDPGTGLGDEALRVVQLMATEGAKWTPGKQRGRPVRVQFNLPVRFKLE
ncbi:MAG: energy transducer TonB [Bacteroidota bacterium]